MDAQSLAETLSASYVVTLGILGLVIGSFLNVVIARVPAGESIAHPPSRCPKCGHQIRWYENIPVLSWLFLRAKCSGCKAPISVRYPLIELVTGGLFLACWLRFGWTWELASALLLVSLLLPLAIIDAEHWILPLEMTVPGIFAGIILAALGGTDRVIAAAWGAVLAFLLLRFMEYVGWKMAGQEAMGAGDKYLYAMCGAFLTHRAILGILLLTSIQAAVVGSLRLLLTGRAGPAATGGDANAGPTGEQPLTMSWAFLAPGLSLPKRLVLLPYSLLFQPIPDEPKDDGGNEVEWVPGASNLPLGPWLALAAVEVMLFGPTLDQWLGSGGLSGFLFGPAAAPHLSGF